MKKERRIVPIKRPYSEEQLLKLVNQIGLKGWTFKELDHSRGVTFILVEKMV